MDVFKFGGASVKDAQSINNVVSILQNFSNQKLVVVVSAIGKTTNLLEEVVNNYFHRKPELAESLAIVKQNHTKIIYDLNLQDTDVINDVNDLFVEIDWVIEDEPHDTYDYIYDQIVSVGELISSKILTAALEQNGIPASWYDVRSGLMTDETHREAKVDWAVSSSRIESQIGQLHSTSNIIVTQGFIGSTKDNDTTTLGREGSDYSASIISFCCNADALHIWKDVPGVLNSDPRRYPNATMLPELSYDEAIEMTYYGAKVIHPKTIKPLQNKGIPLYVRPFDNISSKGTKVGSDAKIQYPPIIVVEDRQALIHISVNDFSFVAEQHLSNIFKLLSDLRIKVNMMKNTAISFTLCVLNDAEKLNSFKSKIDQGLNVSIVENIQLYTIRHFDKNTIAEVIGEREILFEDMHSQCVQIAVAADGMEVLHK
jgi:aspartate kinase